MPNSCHRAGVFTVYSLIAALLVALAGCAVPQDSAELAPTVHVSESTWRRVDRDIGAASVAAGGQARGYAHNAMEEWMSRVRQLTEENFIPWYTSYWTQQWLAMKVAWYEMNNEEGIDLAAERLAAYLQEQYYTRVLGPVADDLDPNEVMGRTTALYVHALGDELEGIPQRYGVPLDQFDGRLEAIPAIVVATVPSRNASLYQTVRAEHVDSLPAYEALMAQIRNASDDMGSGPSDDKMSAVARRAADKFIDKLAVRGGASAAAAVVGGVVGILIAIGATGLGAMAHEKDRPALEAQLRENLNVAIDEMRQSLTEDPATGVMAAVHHICGQIERNLVTTSIAPVQFEPESVEAELFGQDLFEGDRFEGRPLDDDGRAGESSEADQPFEELF